VGWVCPKGARVDSRGRCTTLILGVVSSVAPRAGFVRKQTPSGLGLSESRPRAGWVCPKGARPQSDTCPHRASYPFADGQVSDWGLAPFGQTQPARGLLSDKPSPFGVCFRTRSPFWACFRTNPARCPLGVWAKHYREGLRVARCTVERLLHQLGIQSSKRGRQWKTTIPDELQARSPRLRAAGRPLPPPRALLRLVLAVGSPAVT